MLGGEAKKCGKKLLYIKTLKADMKFEVWAFYRDMNRKVAKHKAGCKIRNSLKFYNPRK